MVVELDLLKGIPGYSMILKAVLKTQIQLLVSIISKTKEDFVNPFIANYYHLGKSTFNFGDINCVLDFFLMSKAAKFNYVTQDY